jgi:hypothetical protein
MRIVNDEKGVAFVETLLDIRNGKHPNKEATRMLRERLLAVGSRTPDNVNCARHIEVGTIRPLAGPLETRCIKLRGRNISITDLLDTIGDGRVPRKIRVRYPDVTEEEWHACLRVVMLILLMFQQDKWPDLDGQQSE